MLKRHKKRLWIPLFVLALGYSCAFPTWVIWEAAGSYLERAFEGEMQLFIAFPIFIFLTYFHTYFLRHTTIQ